MQVGAVVCYCCLRVSFRLNLTCLGGGALARLSGSAAAPNNLRQASAVLGQQAEVALRGQQCLAAVVTCWRGRFFRLQAHA
jgi:hypothetical protein